MDAPVSKMLKSQVLGFLLEKKELKISELHHSGFISSALIKNTLMESNAEEKDEYDLQDSGMVKGSLHGPGSKAPTEEP